MRNASKQMTIHDFVFPPEETTLLVKLLKRCCPRSIAEFGSGGSTRILAENSSARIVTWDNTPAWVDMVRKLYVDKPWIDRVEFRTYTVMPPGPMAVQKDPVAWDGGRFDFLFLDGPRAAHPSSFGRSGTFKFATLHAQKGACILWHDADGGHAIEWAFRCFRHCRIHHHGRMSWCIWNAPTSLSWITVLWNLGRRRYWPLLRRFRLVDILSGRIL